MIRWIRPNTSIKDDGMPKKFTVGIICNPSPLVRVDAKRTSLAIEVCFNALDNIQVPAGFKGIAIISGPVNLKVPQLAKAAADARRWVYRVSPKWSQPDFYEDCLTIFQVGDEQGDWCRSQMLAFPASGKGHGFFIIS